MCIMVNILISKYIGGDGTEPTSERIYLLKSGPSTSIQWAGEDDGLPTTQKIDDPTLNVTTSFGYNGSAQGPSIAQSEGYTISGQTSATEAGTYTLYVTPNAGYTWQDGSSGAKQLTWTITQAQQSSAAFSNAAATTFGQNLALSLSGVQENASVTYSVAAGTGAAHIENGVLIPDKAGTVTVTATIGATKNYAGTTITQTVTIGKAEQNFTLDQSQLSAFTTGKFTVSGASGALSFGAIDNDVIKVNADGTYEVKGVDSATITVTAAGDDNHNKDADVYSADVHDGRLQGRNERHDKIL